MVLSQLSDESLAKYRYAAKTGKKRFYKKGAVSWRIKDNGIFFRKYQSQPDTGKIVKQILVPRSQRANVLRAVHGSGLSRHIGVRKTKEKLMFGYWWPGVEKVIRSYCKSCKACHKTVNKGKISFSQLDKKVVKESFISECDLWFAQIHKPEILTVIDSNCSESKNTECSQQSGKAMRPQLK